MGGKPSLLLPGTAGTKSALWQGGKQPLSDAEGGFFDEWRIGAAVSLGVACVDQQRHPSVGKRLRLPVADEPGAADALRDRLDVAVRFLHACRLDGLNCYVHCARGVSRSSAVSLAYALAYLPEALATPAAATTWLEARRPQALPNAGFAKMLEDWVRGGGRDGCAAALRALDAAQPAAAARLRDADAAAVAAALAAAAGGAGQRHGYSRSYSPRVAQAATATAASTTPKRILAQSDSDRAAMARTSARASAWRAPWRWNAMRYVRSTAATVPTSPNLCSVPPAAAAGGGAPFGASGGAASSRGGDRGGAGRCGDAATSDCIIARFRARSDSSCARRCAMRRSTAASPYAPAGSSAAPG